MMEFKFRAPSLFEPNAQPSSDLEGILHDALGMAARLAKCEAIARWLLAKLNLAGLKATGLSVDESGWIIEAPSNPGFAVCILGGHENDEAHMHALVMSYGGSGEELAKAVSTLLHNSDEITDLQVVDG
ncbi:MAG: hypothetical protein ACRDBL_12045 [Rhabdaerophilum sp.]